MSEDVIAAVSTPFGEGAIAVVRVSGKGCASLLERGFRCAGGRALSELEPRVQYLAKLLHDEGGVVDEVLVTRFEGPVSYTGEDTLELSCHGGVVVTHAVYERVLALGARAAEAGEFTQRAFLNGKMDLTQAEAVMDLISARSSLALKSAQQQLGGKLGDRVHAVKDGLVGLLAHVEAYVDFPEEDIDPMVGEKLTAEIDGLMEKIQSLLGSAKQGRYLRQGVRTVICGAPNVGKSSLLNALCDEDRAMVSAQAGTTRDVIEAAWEVGGFPLRLLDTAGLHASEDVLEQEGMRRSKAQLEDADLIIRVMDVGRSLAEQGLEFELPKTHSLLLLNKCDLTEAQRHEDWSEGSSCREEVVSSAAQVVSWSCQPKDEEQARACEEALENALTKILLSGEVGAQADLVSVNARHQALLQTAGEALKKGKEGLMAEGSPEFAAVDFREALQALGEIVGKVDHETILGEIFGRFCIGK